MLPVAGLIVQFRMTGFHLQLPPGSAHLIPLQSTPSPGRQREGGCGRMYGSHLPGLAIFLFST